MSQIKIEMTSDASDTEKDLGSIDSILRNVGKSAKQVATESSRGAEQTAGSYAKLRAELASNKKALDQLEIGSEAFNEQAEAVAELETQVKEAKQAISDAVAAGHEFEGVADTWCDLRQL